MKIAILSYPMLFQRKGGLQIQILETISELKLLGIDAELVNPNKDMLKDYDLIHVFSAINGNYRLVEAAKGVAKPVVISPLIQPDWSRLIGIRERFFDKIVGRLSGWHIQTTYREIETCLKRSDRIIALGDTEKQSIEKAFLIESDKIEVIGNGIPQHFFNAQANLFCQQFSVAPGFILCVAAINSHKNQLTLVEALKDTDFKIVLIGECLETDKGYLAEILTYPNVLYIGAMNYNDPLLASAYAAAGVFCLPSYSEVMPLSVLESLAAGTPVVMTRHHCMDVAPMKSSIVEIEPGDKISLHRAVNDLFNKAIAPEVSRNCVSGLNWKSVAKKVSAIYESVL